MAARRAWFDDLASKQRVGGASPSGRAIFLALLVRFGGEWCTPAVMLPATRRDGNRASKLDLIHRAADEDCNLPGPRAIDACARRSKRTRGHRAPP